LIEQSGKRTTETAVDQEENDHTESDESNTESKYSATT